MSNAHIVDGLSHLALPIDQVHLNPANTRKHMPTGIETLKVSLAKYGQRKPIVVQRNGMICRAGNGCLQAARELGWTHIAAVVIDEPNTDAVSYEIMDNRSAEVGSEWNLDLLTQQLTALEGDEIDLSDVGFTHENLDEMIAELSDTDLSDVVEDEPPEPAEEPVVRLGDLWLLGDHRVLCGDCTDANSVHALMSGAKADSIITDPPYGVDYASKNEFLNAYDKGNCCQQPICNDSIKDYRLFFASFLSKAQLSDHNTAYVFMSGKELHSLRGALDDAGYKLGDYLVWVKNNHVLGRKDYNAKHEFIVYCWRGKHKFYGGFQTTVIECNKPFRSDLHPTMKPVELVSRLMTHGTTDQMVVYDPFLGSGTTLIAAEQLGRRCYGIEIAPQYVQVALERWRNLTSREPTLEATGQTLAELLEVGRG